MTEGGAGMTEGGRGNDGRPFATGDLNSLPGDVNWKLYVKRLTKVLMISMKDGCRILMQAESLPRERADSSCTGT